MRVKKCVTLFISISCVLFAIQGVAEAATVQFVGRKLQVNNQPFLIKGINAGIYLKDTFPSEWGVCWYDQNITPNPFYCPPAQYRIENLHDIDPLVDQAMLLTAALNGNTYRTFGKIAANPSPLLARANQYGVKIIMGYWIKHDIDFTFPLPNGPTERQALINDFVSYVNALKQDPNYSAVLMHGLSNENNLAWCSFANQSAMCTQCSPAVQAAGFYSLVNDMAAAAKAGDPDPRPIIVVSAELGDIGNQTSGADDTSIPAIDGWGVNSYRGNSFGNLFTDFALRTQKPLVITEWGMDAWDNNPSPPNFTGSTDEVTQEQYIQSLWTEIANEYNSATGVVAGGVVFQMADTWWGGGNVWSKGVAQHNPGGWENRSYPDEVADDEFWGLFERQPGPAKFVDNLIPRRAAFKIQALYQ